MLQAYCLLQIAKLTDPPANVGRENLTIPNPNDRLKTEGLWTQEIDDLSAERMRYRDLIKLRRNRLIAHSDKERLLRISSSARTQIMRQTCSSRI